MSQFQQKTKIVRIEHFSSDIIRLTLDSPEIASIAKPGQFVMVRTGKTNDPLLRRPFSISQTSNGRYFQLLFKVVGRGTSLLAHCREGEHLSVLGPLGKGYRMDSTRMSCLVGGGLGIAPLLFLAKTILRQGTKKIPFVVLGARTRDELAPLIEDFKKMGLYVHAATDDGTLGHHGLVTDVLKTLNLTDNCMMSVCGPHPMMAAVYMFCKEKGYDCQVSMESGMACGIGACLGCIIPVEKGGYAHACSDGPVFDAKELLWQVK
ncbi:MAG: dihydroorotate dehydrogenase electron transfer subunit [Desulfocapsa sp.]|nr:dihydroorotate dehydrogenase electron transfer subunit [Desulfocapsa sp.]